MNCPKCAAVQSNRDGFAVCPNGHAYRLFNTNTKPAKLKEEKKDPLADLLTELKMFKVPMPEREVLFHPTRRFRFDAAWVNIKLAVEFNGIFQVKDGAHQHTTNLMRDYVKVAEAQLLGWIMFSVTAESVRTGEAREWILRAFSLRGWKL